MIVIKLMTVRDKSYKTAYIGTISTGNSIVELTIWQCKVTDVFVLYIPYLMRSLHSSLCTYYYTIPHADRYYIGMQASYNTFRVVCITHAVTCIGV